MMAFATSGAAGRSSAADPGGRGYRRNSSAAHLDGGLGGHLSCVTAGQRFFWQAAVNEIFSLAGVSHPCRLNKFARSRTVGVMHYL